DFARYRLAAEKRAANLVRLRLAAPTWRDCGDLVQRSGHRQDGGFCGRQRGLVDTNLVDQPGKPVRGSTTAADSERVPDRRRIVQDVDEGGRGLWHTVDEHGQASRFT